MYIYIYYCITFITLNTLTAIHSEADSGEREHAC